MSYMSSHDVYGAGRLAAAVTQMNPTTHKGHTMNNNFDSAVSFTSVPQMRVAVTNSGSHFFDRATVRFFNSKVESPIIASRFFITSERMEKSDPKRYTIRYFDQVNGETMCSRELGEFQEFETLAAAKAALREVLNSMP